jgi:hypothetical protein
VTAPTPVPQTSPQPSGRPPRPPWLSGGLGVLIAFVLAGIVVGGAVGFVLVAHEGPVPPPTASPIAFASGATPAQSLFAVPSGSVAASSAPAAASAPPSSGGAPATSAGGSPVPSGLRAVVDRTLLAVLPTTVAGLSVQEFPEAETQAITDPDLGRNVSRVVTAFVGDAGGSNWAYTSVVDVRPQSQSDAFYRDWQESFDTSACAQAGGVTGHTSVVIAGRDVERTACGAGVRTYHVKIPGTGLLVSISDLGAANFGEQEIAALRT